jgi:hypothetical protein
MNNYVIFEGSSMYHVVAGYGATACGVAEDVYRSRGEDVGDLGRVKTFGYRPTSFFPCKRCELATQIDAEGEISTGTE